MTHPSRTNPLNQPQDYVDPAERLTEPAKPAEPELPPAWFAWLILGLIIGFLIGLSVFTSICF